MCLSAKVSFCVFTSFIGELPAAHFCKPSCFAFELQTGSIYYFHGWSGSPTTAAWRNQSSVGFTFLLL